MGTRVAAGAQRQVLYVHESEWGSRPPLAEMTVLRNTGGQGITVQRDSQTSEEFRRDRAVADVNLGVQQATMPVPFELSYGTYDSFLAAALFGDWEGDVLKQGVTPHSFTLEEGYTDIGVYLTMLGAMVDQFSLSFQPRGAMVTGSFGLAGKKVIEPANESIDEEPTPAPSNRPFNSFRGYIKIGGDRIGIATSAEFQLSNQLDQLYALFEDEAFDIVAGRANITGNLVAFFAGKAELEAFLGGDQTSIEIESKDPHGNIYTFLFPRTTWTGNTRNLQENQVTQQLPFQAMFDESSGTQMVITRQEAP